MVLPAIIPVTIPVAPATVALDGEPLLQLPPIVASVNGIEASGQTADGPPIETGTPKTVTVKVAAGEQLVA